MSVNLVASFVSRRRVVDFNNVYYDSISPYRDRKMRLLFHCCLHIFSKIFSRSLFISSFPLSFIAESSRHRCNADGTLLSDLEEVPPPSGGSESGGSEGGAVKKRRSVAFEDSHRSDRRQSQGPASSHNHRETPTPHQRRKSIASVVSGSDERRGEVRDRSLVEVRGRSSVEVRRRSSVAASVARGRQSSRVEEEVAVLEGGERKRLEKSEEFLDSDLEVGRLLAASRGSGGVEATLAECLGRRSFADRMAIKERFEEVTSRRLGSWLRSWVPSELRSSVTELLCSRPRKLANMLFFLLKEPEQNIQEIVAILCLHSDVVSSDSPQRR